MILQEKDKEGVNQFLSNPDQTLIERQKISTAFLEGIQTKPLNLQSVSAPQLPPPTPFQKFNNNLNEFATILSNPDVARPLNDFANALVRGNPNTFGGSLSQANNARLDAQKVNLEQKRFSEVASLLAEGTEFEGTNLDGLSPEATKLFLDTLNKHQDRKISKENSDTARFSAEERADNDQNKLELARDRLALDKLRLLQQQLHEKNVLAAENKPFTPTQFRGAVETAALIPITSQGSELINDLLDNSNLGTSAKKSLREVLNGLQLSMNGVEGGSNLDNTISNMIRQLESVRPEGNEEVSLKINSFIGNLSEFQGFLGAAQEQFSNPNSVLKSSDLLRLASSFSLNNSNLLDEINGLNKSKVPAKFSNMDSLGDIIIGRLIENVVKAKTNESTPIEDVNQIRAKAQDIVGGLVVTNPINLGELFPEGQNFKPTRFIIYNTKVVGILK